LAAFDGFVVDVGEVHDVGDFEAPINQPTLQQILEDEGAEVAYVGVVVDGGAAGVQFSGARCDGGEFFFFAC